MKPVNIPGFTAEASLCRLAGYYKNSVGKADSPTKGMIIPQWYCCIMRYNNNSPIQGVSGCRGHDAWYPFAWAGCVAEAAARGNNATLMGGTCSSRPECRGKIL